MSEETEYGEPQSIKAFLVWWRFHHWKKRYDAIMAERAVNQMRARGIEIVGWKYDDGHIGGSDE